MSRTRVRSTTDPVLWAGLLVAPSAWTLQTVFGLALVPVACVDGRLPLYLLSLAAAGASAAAGGLTAWRWWRGRFGADATASFMAAGGVVVSALFLLIIVTTAAAHPFLDACAPA